MRQPENGPVAPMCFDPQPVTAYMVAMTGGPLA